MLIHDAARPLIDAGTISRTIEALGQHPAILVAVPVVDTIKRGEGERVGDTVDRATCGARRRRRPSISRLSWRRIARWPAAS